MTKSEGYVSFNNSNFFFKEFTFSKNKFQKPGTKEELELADNFVWLDPYLFIFQIKDRNQSASESDEKWFKNKVLNTAVRQIKNSIHYLKEFPEINIQNERGHYLNVAEAAKANPKKLIIYNSNSSLERIYRLQKFYESKTIGLIHLFHLEDYLWICSFLITPYEIDEYLKFREDLFKNQSSVLNNLPEQYILGHYLETTEVNHINQNYIQNIKNLVANPDDFDISPIIEKFQTKLIPETKNQDYYQIIRELAKLNRADLAEFKKRFVLTIEKSKNQEFTLPYRITSLNSKCGFVFIPLLFADREQWSIALQNYTVAHKYEQKLDKCVGMIVYHNKEEQYFDMNWCLIIDAWEYNFEIEEKLKNNFPFREVSKKQTFRYFLKK